MGNKKSKSVRHAELEQILLREKEKNRAIAKIAICVLILIMALGVAFAANTYNPDSDALWLISTGRWIVQNKAFPKINPFTYTENLKTIIQQPLCALLNYFWFSVNGGLHSMWILAIIENAILITVFAMFMRKFSKSPIRITLGVILTEVFFIATGLITTRPYQLTVTNLLLYLMVLENVRRRSITNHPNENIFKGLLPATIFCTLFQANYQMASLAFIPVFAICYAIGIGMDRLRNHNPIRKESIMAWVIIIPIWFGVACINPYGIKGACYLFYSMPALSSTTGAIIQEMQSPIAFSLPIFLCIYNAGILVLKIHRKKEWSFTQVLFVIGSSLATMFSMRNFWMSVIAFAMIYSDTNYKLTEEEIKQTKLYILKENMLIAIRKSAMKYPLLSKIMNHEKVDEDKKIKVTKTISEILLALSFGVFGCLYFLSTVMAIQHTKPIDELVSVIEELPEDAKMFTGFNTGAYAEYAGRKIYIDARPELYYTTITGGTDLLTDWFNFEYGAEDAREYIEASDWDYYLVQKNCAADLYFKYSGTGEQIYSSDSTVLYKLVSEK